MFLSVIIQTVQNEPKGPSLIYVYIYIKFNYRFMCLYLGLHVFFINMLYLFIHMYMYMSVHTYLASNFVASGGWTGARRVQGSSARND